MFGSIAHHLGWLIGTLVVWLAVMLALHLTRPFRRAIGSGLLLVVLLIGSLLLASLAGLT